MEYKKKKKNPNTNELIYNTETDLKEQIYGYQ